MQAYGASYPTYMYAQPPPGGPQYYAAAPPSMTPGIGRSQSSAYHDSSVGMLAPPPGSAYMAMPSPNGHGPMAPHDQEQRVTGERAPRPTHRFTDRSSVSDPTKKPLKSALKKHGRPEHPDLHRSRTVPAREGDGYYGNGRAPELKPTASTMSRGRSISEGKSPGQRPRASSLSRPRSRSQSRKNFTPGLSIHEARLNTALMSVSYRPSISINQRNEPVWWIDAHS